MEKKGLAQPFQALKESGQKFVRSLNSLRKGHWLAGVSLGLMVVVTVGGLFYLAADWNRPHQNIDEDFYWSEPLTVEEVMEPPVAEEPTLEKNTQPQPIMQESVSQVSEAVSAETKSQSPALEADPGPLPEEPLLPVIAPAQAFSDLVCPVQAQVTSPFGWRKHPVLGDWRYHPGVDLDAPLGTEVKAVLAGTVAEVKEDHMWGKMVVIDHANQRRSMYGHLDLVQVEEGQVVEQGQQIGTVGQTGITTKPHLHFELRLQGTAIDPTLYLPVPEEAVPNSHN